MTDTAEDRMETAFKDSCGCIIMFALLIAALLILGGCASNKIPVTVEKVVESKVPVTVPCVKNRPEDVTALRDKLTREEWDRLSTDQREKLLGAQSLDRKAHDDKLSVATAGCH